MPCGVPDTTDKNEEEDAPEDCGFHFRNHEPWLGLGGEMVAGHNKEFDSSPADKCVGKVFESGVFVEELEKELGRVSEEDYADDRTCVDDPEF